VTLSEIPDAVAKKSRTKLISMRSRSPEAQFPSPWVIIEHFTIIHRAGEFRNPALWNLGDLDLLSKAIEKITLVVRWHN